MPSTGRFGAPRFGETQFGEQTAESEDPRRASFTVLGAGVRIERTTSLNAEIDRILDDSVRIDRVVDLTAVIVS